MERPVFVGGVSFFCANRAFACMYIHCRINVSGMCTVGVLVWEVVTAVNGKGRGRPVEQGECVSCCCC